MRPSKYFTGSNSPRRYKISFYANCGTKFVIYLITCLCGSKYVGKTTRPVRKRISEHLNCVSRGDTRSAVAKNLLDCHAGSLCISFQIIDRVVNDARIGDIEISLSLYYVERHSGSII
ncbi:hypothetical protein XELAEV_18001220mg [Xenopus laevis]|nr:hypothetical protein XELAEV_18001220mg [Xenopus laevis]